MKRYLAAGLMTMAASAAAFVPTSATAQSAAPAAQSAVQAPPAGVQPALTPGAVVAAAPASDWVGIPAEDILVMQLAPDPRGGAGRTGERRVVIQLIAPPFSEGWTHNIRMLARVHWWDGLSINRVQENYVVQWGDADYEDPARRRALPDGLRVMGEGDYTASLAEWQNRNAERDRERHGREAAAPVFRPVEPDPYPAWMSGDSYAPWVNFYNGWPVATSGAVFPQMWWPMHCYGMVGVGRDLSPDTGSGAELYVVNGHATRQLDRNIALVGRVIEGMEHLSSLPRGTEALGFYATPEERTGITSIRLASALPEGEQPRFEYLSTESASFARYADVRANRRDEFYIQPAGGVDICNVPVPVRRVNAPSR